jgi:phage-related protein
MEEMMMKIDKTELKKFEKTADKLARRESDKVYRVMYKYHLSNMICLYTMNKKLAK